MLLSAIESLGLHKNKFSLHSLRSGGTSAAAEGEVKDRLFKKNTEGGRAIKLWMVMG